MYLKKLSSNVEFWFCWLVLHRIRSGVHWPCKREAPDKYLSFVLHFWIEFQLFRNRQWAIHILLICYNCLSKFLLINNHIFKNMNSLKKMLKFKIHKPDKHEDNQGNRILPDHSFSSSLDGTVNPWETCLLWDYTYQDHKTLRSNHPEQRPLARISEPIS